MRHGLDRGMLVGITLLAGLTVAIAATSYVTTRRLRDDAGQATLSREFLDTIGAIRTDTRTVQASQRAYLVTGFDEYRKPYQEAAATLRSDAARLLALTAGDSEQHGRALDAGHEIETGIASLDEVVKLRGGVDGHQAVIEFSRKHGPRSFVDPLLETLAKMDLAERDRLELREAETRAAYARAIIYGLASAFLGLGALGMFAWVLRRSVLARARYATRLTDQRELLNATLISIGDGVIATDADGNITFLNGVAETLTGWKSVDAAGLPLTSVFNIVEESSRATVTNPAQRALKEGMIVGLANHTLLISRDGVERPIDDSAAPIRSRGKIAGAVLVFRDISDRKRAEAQAQDAQARIEAILAAGEVATWSWDIQADKVVAGRHHARLFGVSDADAGGGPLAAYVRAIHPDDRMTVDVTTREAIRTGGALAVRYRVLSTDGEYRTVLARGKTEYDSEGKPLRLPGVLLDVTRQARAESELRASEARLRFALEAARMGTWDLDLASGNLSSSDACKLNYGRLPVDSFTYEELAASIHEEDRARWRETVEDAVARSVEFEIEYRALWPDRSEHWVHVRGNCSRDASGKTTGLSGVSYDVTDRKRAQEQEHRAAAEAVAAAEANAKFRTFFEQGTQFAAVLTLDGTVVEANRLCLDACGFARADVIGKKFWECGWWNRSPALVEMVRAACARAAAGELFRNESSYFVADGSERVVELTIAPVTDEAGRVLFVAPTGTDITERKRAEEAVQFLADASASLAELVDHESTLRKIASLAVDGFADWCVVDVLDNSGNQRRLAVTNPGTMPLAEPVAADAVFRASGNTLDDIPHVLRTGEPVVVPDLTVPHPTPAAASAEQIERLRESGISSYLSVPLTARNKVVGALTFLSASARRRFGPEELRAALELARRAATAIENAALYRTLQEQDRRKDEFLATLAHELRNPLAPVRNGIQILQTVRSTDERVGKTLEMMDRQIGHMVRMIDDLMDVARVSSGKVVLRKEPVDLQAVVASAVETTRQAIEAGGHRLTLNLPAEPLCLEADRTRLSQVLSNLLNNAAKYTPDGGGIELSAERKGKHAVIRVTDTGVGIPSEMLPKVFDLFTQVGSSLDRAQGGLGIGLTLVKRLVELHGGTVMAQSAGSGRGSEFTITIPLGAGALDAAKSDLPGGGTSRVKLAILVVDDNRDAAQSLGMLLEMIGHEVKTANDGPQALRILETFRPDLIVLDIGLPGMSGYEVAGKIRESERLHGVTLTALTGWGQDEDRRRTKAAGFDYHLVKPADLADVEKILKSISKRS